MQDDSPWKPPTEGGQPAAPSLPSIPPPAAPVVPPPPVAAAPAAPVAPTDWIPSAPDGTVPTVDPMTGPTSGRTVDADAIVVPSGEPPTRGKRSKWLVGGATVAVMAVGAAGVFAVSNLAGSPQGGAATPDELGLTLLQAIENEDVLGVVDVLAPGERDVFRDPLVDLVGELTRLEVLSTDADLSRILGVDVEFSNEAVSSTSTNVPDITNIDLRADAVVTLDGSQLPVGDLITDNLDEEMLTEMRGTRLTESDELDIRLTAIEEDGRWYFSVFHTIAELARAEVAPGTLIPVEGIGADGADTPEAAFDGVLDRVEAVDLTGLLRTLNPGEAGALQRYAPLFLEDAEAIVAEAPLRWAITRREFRVDETGDTATVFLDAIAIEGTVDDESFDLEFADGCVRASAAGESFEQCNDQAFEDATGFLDGEPELEQFLTTLTDAFADMEEVGLEMRRTDGLWYVSPVSTMTEGLLAVLRALDRAELDAIIEQAPAVGEAFGDAILGGLYGFPGGDFSSGGFTTDEYSDDDEYRTEDSAAAEAVEVTPGVAVDGGSDGASAPWEDCYSESDPAVALDCFDSAFERGEIDRMTIPLALRHPECGYTATWGGGLFSLPDEEFTALAEAARPCFLDLVERGEVDEYELPSEITHLECFEGRNWYNVFDDPGYDERYYACLEAAFEG